MYVRNGRSTLVLERRLNPFCCRFGNSPMSLLQRWHIQPEHEAMYSMAKKFLEAGGVRDLQVENEVLQAANVVSKPNIMPVGARVQHLEPEIPVSEREVRASNEDSQWQPRSRTIPWGPLATWRPDRTIEVVYLELGLVKGHRHGFNKYCVQQGCRSYRDLTCGLDSTLYRPWTSSHCQKYIAYLPWCATACVCPDTKSTCCPVILTFVVFQKL